MSTKNWFSKMYYVVAQNNFKKKIKCFQNIVFIIIMTNGQVLKYFLSFWTFVTWTVLSNFYRILEYCCIFILLFFFFAIGYTLSLVFSQHFSYNTRFFRLTGFAFDALFGPYLVFESYLENAGISSVWVRKLL